MIVALAIFNSLLMVAGQTLWKLGARDKDIHSLGQLLRLFGNPYILAGLAVYVCASVLWIYVLNKAELSFAYPIQSAAFIFALLIGVSFFKEQLTVWKIAGVLVICIGVFLITRSPHVG
jgi:drug/metabolite transporter (DMT)-like permease